MKCNDPSHPPYLCIQSIMRTRSGDEHEKQQQQQQQSTTLSRKVIQEKGQPWTDWTSHIAFDLLETSSHGHSLLYYKPASHSQSLIVLLHGGPHNLFAASFNSDIHYYLRHGHCVLVVNYHGSAGYGDRYLHSLCGQIGRIEVDDVVETVHMLKKSHTHLIDFNRMFVMGSSFGGYLGMQLLTKTQLFKVSIKNRR